MKMLNRVRRKSVLSRCLLILLSLAFVFVGCSDKNESGVNEKIYDTPLNEYIENSPYMQENIRINFDTSKITLREKANTYDCKVRQFDRENAKEKLLKGDIIEETTNSNPSGTSVTYITDSDEMLSFDEWVNIAYYGNEAGKNFDFPQNAVVTFTDQLLQHNYGYSINDYGQNTDLAGQTGYGEVLDNFMNTLEQIGIEDAEPYVSYALDCETMNRQAELNKEYGEKRGMEDREEKVYTKEDEGYLMVFRQTVDSIPVLAKDFSFVGLNEFAPTSQLRFEYSDFGINNFRAIFWLDTDSESAQENKLISPSQAMESLLKSYDDKILLSDIYVDDMELSYMALIDSKSKDKIVQDRVYKLVPVWAFEVGEDLTVKYDHIEYETTYTEYNYVLINAISGERINTPYIEEK